MTLLARFVPFLCAILALGASLVHAEDFLTCGGFIKSEIQINFARIEVKLYTKQGALKYQTDCAPNNGYFMIPVYDRGDFVLKLEPPSGWSFEPTSVDLKIDGESDPCSQGKDINFFFKGYTVSGKVVSKGKADGPEGVLISVKPKDKDAVAIETRTKTGGVYNIPNVLPGDFIITASHPTWTFQKASITHTVTKDTATVDSPIIVSGYDVRGKVMSEGEPIKNVFFILFSDTVKPEDVAGCQKSVVNGYQSEGKSPLCHVQSDVDGQFVFPSLGSGVYRVVPFYMGEHTTFDVVPSSLQFTVEHNTIQLPTVFQVAGFSISGRVLSATGGKGVEGAKVKVQGKPEVTTRSDGTFRMEKIKSGTYTLKASKEHLTFDPLNVKVTPNTPKLPDIVASKFSVCGRVETSAGGQRKVSLTKEGSKQPEIATTDKDGAFCFSAAPGAYVMEPMMSEVEQAAGLRINPESQKVTVSSSPVLDINFSQFKATLRGSIKCLDVCGTLQLMVESKDGRGFKKPVPVSQQTKQAAFIIKDILPGKYSISVVQTSWCWSKSSLDVEVVDQDIGGLEFQQSGYVLHCHVSHPIELVYSLDPSASYKGSFTLNKGVNQFCLEKPGSYKLTPKSCHQFEKSEYTFQTSAPNMLTLTALKHQIHAEIRTTQPVLDITVSISSGGKLEQTVKLGPLKSRQQLEQESKPPAKKSVNETAEKKPTPSPSGPQVYDVSHWAGNGEVLEIAPSSGEFLFYPSTVKVTVESGEKCPGVVAEFEGRPGVFITGQVTPPLSGVKVTITPTNPAEGSTDGAITQMTDNKGQYRVGPLPDTSEYEVEASLDGYIMSQEEGKLGYFRAFKLGKIRIEVTDGENSPLSGVLLSLSGGNFRSNNLTKDDGILTFGDLGPDTYFLRALMKEFEFDPSTQMIEVSEGSAVDIKVKGRRVAFSCFGSVTSLNGEPEPGIAVEAHSEESCGQVVEEGVSDEEGNFRIRGLQPNCDYKIKLKDCESNGHIERASPPTQTVAIGQKVIKDLRIIVFRHLNQFDIGGNIVTPHEYLTSLKVSLYSEEDPETPIHTLPLDMGSFFQFSSVPNDGRRYMIKLESTLPRSKYDYTLPEASFTSTGYQKHVTLPFNPQKRALEQEVMQGSYFALPLVVALIAVGVNHAKIMPFILQFRQNMRGLQSSGPTSRSETVNFDADLSRQRKKVKPRKT
ncbi:nodal modulator 3 [Strongylocentrotus purpuratus]|uniref:Nodal modulator 1 n=1 Tax=Strongylocentrotus purpuratus TaxID=7668 RepID=A0A7M7N9R7_STRPU|nr:nodal modulator 3 [Strongylocentrotus purpuratus]